MPDLVLFQPDIAGNTGTLMRLAACLDFTLHIIEPAGFRLDDKTLRRAGMDYLELAKLHRHDDWESFSTWAVKENRRMVLTTTKAKALIQHFKFEERDLILMGRESSGAPQMVHDQVDHRLRVPMKAEARSINQALCATMVMTLALAQTDGFNGI